MTELSATDVSEPPAGETSWHPWRVAPDSGFEVADPSGNVGLIQINRKKFLVENAFRFADSSVIAMLTDHLVRSGKTAEEAQRAVEDAQTFTPTTENPTDLASIPRYLRWFESAYGAHTLAAIIHDDLIVDKPNGGPLEDDTLSDRFFREMMKSAEVPWLKRWIMWSAVALRSRWAVGGIRRLSVLDLAPSVCGRDHRIRVGRRIGIVRMGRPGRYLGSAVWSRWCFRSPPRSCGASNTAPASSRRSPRLWILPAALLAGVGYLVYLGLESAAGLIGLD